MAFVAMIVTHAGVASVATVNVLSCNQQRVLQSDFCTTNSR